MNVKIQTDGYLENLKREIEEEEQESRKADSRVKVWYVQKNDLREFYAVFESFKTNVLNEIKTYEADVNLCVKFGTQMLSEEEVKSWPIGKCIKRWY